MKNRKIGLPVYENPPPPPPPHPRYTRPPLGLMPRFMWEGERLFEVCSAITRRYQSCMEIPIEWVREYNELIIKKSET